MENFNTRERMTRQCVQEAIAVQDMLSSAAFNNDFFSRLLARVNSLLAPRSTMLTGECAGSTAHELFDLDCGVQLGIRLHQPEGTPALPGRVNHPKPADELLEALPNA